MSLQEKLTQLYSGLTSDRVTERKKCTDSLKDFLSGSGMPSILTENHRRNSGLTWKNLFAKVHELIIKEVEKFDSGKGASTHDTVRIQCSSLLISVITGANKAKCYISSDKLLECCLEAFKSLRIMRHFSETYTTILYKHVLQVPHYLNLFSPYEWADLLEASIELHKCPSMDKSTAVKLVCSVIEEGTNRCQLALAVRDNLPSIANVFLVEDIQKHHHMQENLLRIAICVINNIGAESRQSVCNFTEAIILNVIQFYEQSMDVVSNKKKYLFTFLHLCIIIHHPGPGLSLAGDWSTWMQAVRNIQQIVRTEGSLLESSVKRFNYQQMIEMSSQFITLVVELYHRIFIGSLQIPSDNDESSVPAKRIRLESNEVTSYTTLLQSISVNNCFPWILIAGHYFKKYNSALYLKEIQETLNLFLLLLDNNDSHNKTLFVLDGIAMVCDGFEENQSSVQFHANFATIWGVCVRKSTENVLFEKCHKVMQSCLQKLSVNVPIDELIKNYLDKNIPTQFVHQGLFTLSLILSQYNHKINNKQIRMALADWVLSNCFTSTKCQEIASVVLFQLSINENICLNEKIVPEESTVLNQLFDNVQNLIMKSDFQNGLLHSTNAPSKAPMQCEKCVTVSEYMSDYVFSQLNNRQSLENLSDVCKSLKNISTALKVYSCLEKHKLPGPAVCLNLKERLFCVFEQLPRYIKSIPQSTKETKEFLQQLRILFHHEDYTKDIYGMICNGTTKEMIESFCGLLNDFDEPDLNDSMELMKVDLDQNPDTESSHKSIILRILVNFCMSDTSYRNQILTFILGADLYDFSSTADFEIAVGLVRFVLEKFDPEVIPVGSLSEILQEMCKKLYRNNTSSYTILQLLYQMLDVIRTYGTSANRENAAIMLNSFLTRCNGKFYTPKTMGQVLKCVSWIQNTSGIAEWGRRWDGSILQSTSNTIHSVRLYGCLCLGYQMKNATLSKFNELVSTLPDVFLIDERDLTENVISDESANRTSTVLHCLSLVAVCSPVWDKMALAELLKLSHKKRLSPILIGKVFQCIAKHHNSDSVESLMIDNLLFFVNSWLSDGLSLEDFPYYLLLCQTRSEFFSKFQHVLVPYDVLWSGNGERSSVLEELLQSHQIPVNMVYKNCLPSALALIVPYILHEESITSKWSPSRKLQSSAKNFYALLCKTLKEEVVLGSVTENPVDFLKILLSYLSDEEDIRKDTGWSGSLPHLEGPILNIAELNAILNWFNEKLQIEIIFHLCCDNSSAIQQLLLHLWENIEKQNSLERKILGLHQYWKFCHMLPLLTKLNTFIGQNNIQTALHLIEKYNELENMQYLAVASCKMLYSMFKRFLPDQAPTVSKMLSSTVCTITRAMRRNDRIKESAVGLLVFLIIDMSTVLPDVQFLDPLPDEVCFSKMNNVLRIMNNVKNDTIVRQIKTFLQGGVTGRFEGLKVLHARLASSPKELTVMFKKLLETRWFYDDCKDSILHRLACTLIEIATNKQDKQCCMEAIRCLGVLGVSDYQTLTIQSPPDPTSILRLAPVGLVALHALQHLSGLCISSQPLICKSTGVAITSLLKYKEGVTTLDSLTESEETSHLKDFLLPYTSTQKSWPAVKIKLDVDNFQAFLSSDCIWSLDNIKEHSDWVVSLANGILKSFSNRQCFLMDMTDVCQLSETFSEKIVPSLFGLVFSHGTEEQIKSLVAKIQSLLNEFHDKTLDLNVNTSQKNGLTACCNKAIMKSMECLLNAIKFAFVQKKHYPNVVNSTTSSIRLFNLDLFTCSWAACRVGHHLAAIYFAELWCMTELDGSLPSSPDKIAELPNGKQMLSVMRKSYECMCDDAALTGCGSFHLLDPVQRRQHYLRMGSYTEALLMHDCDPNQLLHSLQSNLTSKLSFTRSLQTAGLYQLAESYVNSLDLSLESSQALEATKYECCWRLGDWSLQIDSASLKSESSSRCLDSQMTVESSDYLWPAHHYLTLKNAITKNAGKSIANELGETREYVALHCMQNSLESSQSVYELCAKLQILHEIECFVQLREKYLKSKDILDLHSFLTSWSVETLPPFPSFKLVDEILSQRSVILESLCALDKSGQPLDREIIAPVVELLLQYADLAVSEGCHQLGVRLTSKARFIVESVQRNNILEGVAENKIKGLIVLAEGNAAWHGGHHTVAQHLLKTFIANPVNHEDNHTYAEALRLYGTWMVESRSESALDILEKYLTKSLQVLGPRADPKERMKTYITIAKFSDGEYKQMDTYVKSAAFVNKIKCMEQCKVKADSLKENQENKMVLTKDEKKAMFLNDAQSKIDQIEIFNTKAERNYYLQLAIKYYLTTLLEGDTDDLCIFRVISLWFDNPSLELVSRQNTKSLESLLKSIPSRKLLPVVSQLAPRLNSVDPQPHHKIIFDLIERCLLDHPHHVLPVLLALKNSYKDVEYSEVPTPSQAKAVNEAYVVSAKKMLDGAMKKGNPNIVSIIKETEILSLALISLANYKVRNSKSFEQLIPKAEPLKKMKNLKNALIPTVTIPVRADCNYQAIPSVGSFADKFLLVGGINVPKKISCLGSDGIERPMLLKGEDDIRQDAVMQQVFVIVNQLLAGDQHRDTRRLFIRTYKVVALSRRSGIIEWCDGTEPLGRLLVGTNGATGLHASVRPKDMSSKEARKMMDEKRTSTNNEKLKVFKEILNRLKPVFHHFFFQNFLIPAVWYERKLAYTYSVATTSMIGYILGLGDRHVQNILVDKATAEVIHIDLGIAFEQGRVQPTPETVPFRLTQDMVAGLGAAGVEGVFTKCCEKTMDVLRSNKDTLLTILEVLLCDPLYMWTISPRQAYSKQDLPVPTSSNYTETSGGSGSEAERALLRVNNKLEGTEFGSALATPGQVARLIQQATDINNLSRLFPGWQPYL